MKKSKKLSIPEHYDSLDAPIFVWNKVHETSDLSWLLVSRQPIVKPVRDILEKAWEKIYDEYLKEFGFSDQFLVIKEKEIEVAQLKLEYILTGNRTLLTWIAIGEDELTAMKGDVGRGDFMQSQIAIENKFKFQINEMTTSIRKFYSYLKQLK